MKKSELRKIIKEEMNKVGYSKFISGGKTTGSDDDFKQILWNLVHRKDQKALGNDALDKADPENIKRILKGEKPIYEGEGDTMDLQQLVDYITGLSPEVLLYIPTIYPGGFGKDQQTRRTVEEAIQELTDLLDSPEHNETQFKLYQDSPTFKKFSVVISPEELAKRTAMVRSMGSLD